MLQQLKNADRVAGTQRDSLVSRDNFLRGRQSCPHHEGCQIEVLIRSGGGQDTLLLTRGAKLDPIITDSRGWHGEGFPTP